MSLEFSEQVLRQRIRALERQNEELLPVVAELTERVNLLEEEVARLKRQDAERRGWRFP